MSLRYIPRTHVDEPACLTVDTQFCEAEINMPKLERRQEGLALNNVEVLAAVLNYFLSSRMLSLQLITSPL